MKISAYKTDDKTGVTSSIDIEYDASNEKECMDAAIKLGPYAPIAFPFSPMKDKEAQNENADIRADIKDRWALSTLLLLFALM